MDLPSKVGLELAHFCFRDVEKCRKFSTKKRKLKMLKQFNYVKSLIQKYFEDNSTSLTNDMVNALVLIKIVRRLLIKGKYEIVKIIIDESSDFSLEFLGVPIYSDTEKYEGWLRFKVSSEEYLDRR